MTTLHERRMVILRTRMRVHGHDAEDYDEECEEDVRPYFAGDRTPDQWMAVTLGRVIGGGSKHYFYPHFTTREEAIARTIQYVDDDVFDELPVNVVDLDTGQTWWPDWSTLEFVHTRE